MFFALQLLPQLTVKMSGLPADFVQELKSFFANVIEGHSKAIKDLLDSFKRNDVKYSKAFLKHIPDEDASLRSKYELVCELRKTAVEDHETEIMREINRLHAQSEAIQHFVKIIADANSNQISTDSGDFESVSIKLEPEEDRKENQLEQIGDRNNAQNECSNTNHVNLRKRLRSTRDENHDNSSKRRRVNINEVNHRDDKSIMESFRCEMRQLAEQYGSIHLERMETVFHTHFHRNIRSTFNGEIKLLIFHFPELFRMEYNAKSNQWTVISRLYPNASGYWRYRSDAHYKMVLDDDPVTGQVIGFMVFRNKKQFPIEGHRQQRGSYKLDKLHSNGERVHYSVSLGPEEDTMSIIKDGTSKTKTVKLESRDIPPRFQAELVCSS